MEEENIFGEGIIANFTYISIFFIENEIIKETLHNCSYPRVIDPSQTGLRFVQDKESSEVGGVRSDNDHRKAGPDHS